MSEIALILAIGAVYYWIYEHHVAKSKGGGTRHPVKFRDFPRPPVSMQPPPRPVRPKKRIMSYQCMDCDWTIRDVFQTLIVKQCPDCTGPVMTGEREGIEYIELRTSD